MKTDLDSLMTGRGLDALVVLKYTYADAVAMKYLTGNASLGSAILVKRRGEAPVLVCGAFEREEAAKSGLAVHTYNDFRYTKLLHKSGNDALGAQAKLWGRVFDAFGVSGRVGLYGIADPGEFHEVTARFLRARNGVEFVGEAPRKNIFVDAMRTKDPSEIAHMRDTARRTSAVMLAARDFVAGHALDGEAFAKADGSPLTVGDVKRFVRVELLEHDLEDAAGFIFAAGRDGGVPHSHGEDGDVIKLGVPVVFDLYPRDRRSGYFHDVTRTWCFGHAPGDVEQVYDHVYEAFHAVLDSYRAGGKCSAYQAMACEVFEAHGHTTVRQEPGTVEGYVHGLGHGVGLNVHEGPWFSHMDRDEVLQPSSVFTLEPGLYYPDSKGFGVRIEDTLYLDERGQVHSLSDVPKDLVVPV
jgi:Xaa-Pro aminopeptidase